MNQVFFSEPSVGDSFSEIRSGSESLSRLDFNEEKLIKERQLYEKEHNTRITFLFYAFSALLIVFIPLIVGLLVFLGRKKGLEEGRKLIALSIL